jgi:hypothetical protein
MFSLRTDTPHRAQLTYDAQGAELRLDRQSLGRVEGGAARLVTGESGQPLSLLNIDERAQTLRLFTRDRLVRQLRQDPDARVSLTV